MTSKEFKLNDICNLITCGVAKRPVYVNEGVPFLSSTNVKENRFQLDSYNYISEDDYQKLTKYSRPTKGDILYTRVGSFGEAAVVDFDFKFAIFVSLTLIKPKIDQVDCRFLMWFLNSPKVRALANNSTSGIGVQNLNVGVVREFKIFLPSLPNQKQIADTLDKADALHRKDQGLLQKYDELVKSIFNEMFGDPAQNKKGWPVRTLEELVSKEKYSLKRGPFGGALKKEIFKSSGYLVYEQYHAINDAYDLARYFIDNEKFDELKAFSVLPGDLIISCSGVTLGRISEIPKDSLPGIINQALLKVKLDHDKIINDFFIFQFRGEYVQKKLFGFSRGSGIPNFPPMEEVKAIEFIVPPIEMQIRFCMIYRNISLQKEKIISANSKKLFELLLSESFN